MADEDKQLAPPQEGKKSYLDRIGYDQATGVQIRTAGDLWRFSDMILQSRLAPKGLDSVQSVMIAIQKGAELGLKPMTAIQSIAVINGRPCMYGDLLLAQCRKSPPWDEGGFRESWSEDGTAAICECRRKGGNTCSRTFSIEDAKRAKLWGKQGPWTEYPQRMLQLRARAFALRDTFSDVLQGLYATEELQGTQDYSELEVIAADGEVISAEPPPQPDMPKLTVEDLSKKAKKKTPKPKELEPEPEPESEPEVEQDISVEVQNARMKLANLWGRMKADKKAAADKKLEEQGYMNYAEVSKSNDIADLDVALGVLLGA